jgi:thiol-disulfide isomerase/thioredoxin
VLYNPAVYAGVPALGEPPPYLPVARATSAPVLVVQAGDTNNRWYLDGLLERLRAGGAPVFTRLLPGVRSLFYFDQPNLPEARQRERLPRHLAAALGLLARTPHPLAAAPLSGEEGEAAGLDHALAPYRGRVAPRPIALETAAGEPYRVADYRGQVTVLNFWATWCPPCVEEIPALNNLREAMAGEPFELVSVNYGEEPAEVLGFMERVQVDFPVLMDPDGRVSAAWRVFTLPSTFVIGPDGAIAYGVNAAIPWDAPEVVAALRALAERSGEGP